MENRTSQQPGVSPTPCLAWVGSPRDRSTESWERNGVNLSVASTLPTWPCVHCQLFCRQWTRSFCRSVAFCSLAPTILCSLLAMSGFPARQFSYLFARVWQTSPLLCVKDRARPGRWQWQQETGKTSWQSDATNLSQVFFFKIGTCHYGKGVHSVGHKLPWREMQCVLINTEYRTLQGSPICQSSIFSLRPDSESENSCILCSIRSGSG